MNIEKKISGSVTVFLSLTLVLILSLIFSLIESAKVNVTKWQIYNSIQLGLDSTFGCFCKELFEEYGIFAINPSDVNVTNTIFTFTSANMNPSSVMSIFEDNYCLLNDKLNSVNINETICLSDYDGEYFSKQIREYMKYKKLSDLSEDLLSAGNESVPDIYDFSNDEFDESTIDLSILDDPPKKDHSESLALDKKQAQSLKASITDKITHNIQKNILKLILDDPSDISTITVDKVLLPSSTAKLSSGATAINEGYEKSNEIITPDRIILSEYANEVFGSFLKEHKESYLKYEQEYLINGQCSDDLNLMSSSIKLAFLRGSFNAAYIISDSKKRTTASDLALSVVGPTPILKQLTEFTIISAWGLAEGIIDVKDLLKGKKVPLLKNSKTWTLSLDSVPYLASNTGSKNKGDDGYDYSFYIRILLAAQSELALRYRMLDLIQLNICKNYNSSFRINNCIIGLDVDYKFTHSYSFASLALLSSIPSREISVRQSYIYN